MWMVPDKLVYIYIMYNKIYAHVHMYVCKWSFVYMYICTCVYPCILTYVFIHFSTYIYLLFALMHYKYVSRYLVACKSQTLMSESLPMYNTIHLSKLYCMDIHT